MIRAYFDHFEKHELDEALAMLSDDLVWWIIGKPDLYPNAGLKSKADIARIFARVDSFLQNWVKMTIRSIIAEGDRVAIEVESNAVAKNGKPYNNTFSFFFLIRDEKIVEVREYFDIMHAAEIFRS
jgi:ketosteroid isomerase-like protein